MSVGPLPSAHAHGTLPPTPLHVWDPPTPAKPPCVLLPLHHPLATHCGLRQRRQQVGSHNHSMHLSLSCAAPATHPNPRLARPWAACTHTQADGGTCYLQTKRAGANCYREFWCTRQPWMRIVYFYCYFVLMHLQLHMDRPEEWSQITSGRVAALSEGLSEDTIRYQVLPIGDALAALIDEVDADLRYNPYNHAPFFRTRYTAIVDTFPVYVTGTGEFASAQMLWGEKYQRYIYKVQIGVNFLGEIVLWTGLHFGREADIGRRRGRTTPSGRVSVGWPTLGTLVRLDCSARSSEDREAGAADRARR